ncbi:MAG: cytosine permease [Pseudomonadota bacterium]
MGSTPDILEDYATTPVPEDKTYSGVRVGFVLGGIGIALPALLSGAEVGRALGYTQSLIAFVVAGTLVTALAMVSGFVGMRSRLSTYMILRFSFGPTGAKLVSFTFALSQFGWFGVNAYFFGIAAQVAGESALGLSLGLAPYIVGGGVLMTLATLFGFKALDRLALFVFPVMLTTLMVMIAWTFSLAPLAAIEAVAGTGTLSFAQAVTALSGGIIVGVLLIPDLTRYARGPVDVLIAVLIALAFIEPIVHLAASGAAIHLAATDPLTIMLALGFGAYALFFLLLTSVTTNAVNLYGTGLSMASILPAVPPWIFVLVTGVAGTALALVNIADVFIDFLVWQSILFSSVLGIYVVDFFFVHRQDYTLDKLKRLAPVRLDALIAWASGAFVAALTYREELTLTTMPNLDGVLAGGLVYFLLHRLRHRTQGGNRAARH